MKKTHTKYALGIDVGPTNIGAAVIFLDDAGKPKAISRAMVSIFRSGLTPKSGSSTVSMRRAKRSARRNHDRYLKRRARLMQKLIAHGFFPQDKVERSALVTLNPYALRAEGLDRQLTPQEFARAVYHLNQRRGFQSNRKSDKADDVSKKMAGAISLTKKSIEDGSFRTVGEWLRWREKQGLPLRARPSQDKKTYDLYIDRSMVKHEFNMLWEAQKKFNPELFGKAAYDDISDALFFQRNLHPGNVGLCTLDVNERRAPKALPSSQLFRIVQELNHLRIEDSAFDRRALTLAERNILLNELNRSAQIKFTAVRKLLGLGRDVLISHDNSKQDKIKGNTTSVELSKSDKFGSAWFDLPLERQDEIVEMVLSEKSEEKLILWLCGLGLNENAAQNIAAAGLAEGYGMLSKKTLNKLLPEMLKAVVPYNVAVTKAGFASHSELDASSSGEIMDLLPYYGQVLARHVSPPEDTMANICADEAAFGKITNVNVHIVLNQMRKLVNQIIAKYGHPSRVVVEVARDLKKSYEERSRISREQNKQEKHNERLREEIAEILGISPLRVGRADVEKMKLWLELEKAGGGVAHCPYSGVVITKSMALSSQVEVDHILPFADTLDDAASNKTLCMVLANRVKRKRSPWEASEDFAKQGWNYKDIVARVSTLPEHKKMRFLPDAMKSWLKDSSDFLARHLNDTAYISRLAREYLSVICPQDTYVIPGKLTALLRGKFGLNTILSHDGKKNRADHRHHAIDACVIGITSRELLRTISTASAREWDLGGGRLIGHIDPPFTNFRAHVERAIGNCIVHHKKDHGHTWAMMDEKAGNGKGELKKRDEAGCLVKDEDGHQIMVKMKSPIFITDASMNHRHGVNEDGSPRPYKSYESGSNYCVEIVSSEDGGWVYEFISTYDAYQIERKHGKDRLNDKRTAQSGKPLVMRLMADDMLQIVHNGIKRFVRVVKMAGGRTNLVYLIDHNEANVDARVKDEHDALKHISKSASSLKTSHAKQISVSYLGVVKFKGA